MPSALYAAADRGSSSITLRNASSACCHCLQSSTRSAQAGNTPDCGMNALEFAIRVTQVEVRRRPHGGRTLHALGQREGLQEIFYRAVVAGSRIRVSLRSSRQKKKPQGSRLLCIVERDDSELVEDERVVRADLLRAEKVLLRERDVGETEMLHPDEKERKVRAGQVSLRGRVGCDRLIVLAFVGERVSVGDPCRTKARIDEDCFPARSNARLVRRP
mgnify:CR=1 FL=1|jgi:hypothetical protein